MRTSVLTRSHLEQHRFLAAAQQARLHARTGTECVTVEQVVSAVLAGQLHVREGHAAVSALLRDL